MNISLDELLLVIKLISPEKEEVRFNISGKMTDWVFVEGPLQGLFTSIIISEPRTNEVRVITISSITSIELKRPLPLGYKTGKKFVVRYVSTVHW